MHGRSMCKDSRPPGIAPRAARRCRLALAALALCSCGSASACWQQAAERYGVNAWLLYAIAKTESNLDPYAINRNKNGSRDVGLMQINSTWFPVLRTYGISERQLYQPCVNIYVGAWILAQNMRRPGYSWEAVGAYNARNPTRRIQYALKVYRNLAPQADAVPQSKRALSPRMEETGRGDGPPGHGRQRESLTISRR